MSEEPGNQPLAIGQTREKDAVSVYGYTRTRYTTRIQSGASWNGDSVHGTAPVQACRRSEEDHAASMYWYTGTLRANSQGASGRAREEDAAGV